MTYDSMPLLVLCLDVLSLCVCIAATSTRASSTLLAIRSQLQSSVVSTSSH
jgi:hypothetical protein